MTNIKWVYMTAGSAEEARAIGNALLAARLAACVNILDNMNSLYWWENEIKEDREAVLIAKTQGHLVPELISKVKALHSYEIPCIEVLSIESGYIPFLNWIKTEARGE